MKQKKEDKKIPNKNYIEVLIMFIISFIVVSLAFYSYNAYQDYQEQIPIIKETVSEIDIGDLDNYIQENEDFFLYLGIPSDKNCREVEVNLKEVLKDRNIADKTIYLNLSKVDNVNNFLSNFNEKYSDTSNLKKYPAFIMFRGGKTLDLVQRTTQKLTIGDIEHLLDVYEIEGK